MGVKIERQDVAFRGIVYGTRDTEHRFLPSIVSAAIAFDDSTAALFSIGASEIWYVHACFINVTTNFDADGDATYVIGDGNDANGLVDLVDAELQTADTEGTGWSAGWQGQLSGTTGVYLTQGLGFIYNPSAAETIDGTGGGTNASAGVGRAYLVYTRLD